MESNTLFVAIVTALTSGGTLAFIQYLITRSDNKKDKKDETFASINSMLDEDDKKIKQLESDITYIKKTQTQILNVCLVVLDELKKNNDADGIIHKTEKDMKDFLLNNR